MYKYIATRIMLIIFGVGLALGIGSVNLALNAMADPLTVCIDNQSNLTATEVDAMLEVTRRETLRIFGKRVEFGCGNHRLRATLVASGESYAGRLVKIRGGAGGGAYNDLENWIAVFPYTKTNMPDDYLAVDGGLLAHELGHAIGYPHRDEKRSILNPMAPCVVFNVSNCLQEERHATDPIMFQVGKIEETRTLIRGLRQ